MKKSLLLIIFLIIIFTGCQRVIMPSSIDEPTESLENTTQTSSVETIEKETTIEIPNIELPTEEESMVPDAELNIMQRVLLNMEKFIDTEDGVSKDISTVSDELWSERGMKSWYEPYGFFYIDLDGNTKNEVVALTESGIRMIFYEIDNQIYMNRLFRSQMDSIYADGVYKGSIGADSRHTERIKTLTVNGMEIETILIERFQNFTPDETNTGFYITWDDYNNQVNDISRKEAMARLENCSKVELREYDFTRNNIETIIIDYN